MSDSDNASAPFPAKLPFPVVGIGASAGGLQAAIKLFEQMPKQAEFAFVIILHLSPKHASAADAILQRATALPVQQVTGSVQIEPGHIYVIAPNTQIEMDDGQLRIAPANRPAGQHVAIDVFFRTLADVHRERAIGVILSGTGTDGAVGLARIKEQGGVTIAQSPDDAEHAGMPLAAIETGAVDFVLPVVDIPQKLLDLWTHSRQIELPALGELEVPLAALPIDPAHSAEAEQDLHQILTSLAQHTGHDFRHYKRATVLRRIERRLQVRGVHRLGEYLALLNKDPAEHEALLDDMLIGVTNFFRDRESFETLQRDILPELFLDKGPTDEVRAWVAACSTGEEAYSIAILLCDQAAQMPKPPVVQVFASDIDADAIATARSGVYPASIVTDVYPPHLRQFFTKEENRYRIRKNVRDRILFAVHNLLRDPPFSKLDLVSCRNLLIYLNRDVQIKVLEMFHFALNPGGYLFLGSSESAEAVAEFFTPVDKKARIYRAKPIGRIPRFASPMAPLNWQRAAEPQPARQSPRRQFSYAELHQRALAQIAPPSVVVDRDANIVYMSEHAGKYLRVAPGEPSRNVLAMVLPELRIELRTALYQVQQSGVSAEGRLVHLKSENADTVVHLSVRQYTDEREGGDFYLVLFEETPGRPGDGPQQLAPGDDVLLAQLEAELQRSKEQLQETIEHSEISGEELRASNEELQAINEELRSATEELETSKEELQSVNEELVTVNYELKVKVEETAKTNDDLNNLIASTDIATVFVDSGMRIKRFTPRAADIFSIIPTDAGRSLLDITHRLDYGTLEQDIEETFSTLRPVEREVRSNDGRFYLMRLLPYRTVEDRIDGAVMTFFDISRLRAAEQRVEANEERMRLVAESTRDYAIITFDTGGFVTTWNKGAELIFGYTTEEALGQHSDFMFTQEDRARGIPALDLHRARTEGRSEDERWHLCKDGTRVYCSGVTTPLGPDARAGYAKIARDETSRVQQDQQREAALSHEHAARGTAESANALKDEFLAVVSHELRHPLNVINMNIELLSRMPAVRQSPSTLRAMQSIRGSVSSQAKIIDDLLDMSRLGTGKLALSLEDLNMAELAQAAMEGARGQPAAEALKLELQCDEPSLMVRADPVRMEQVLTNLLHNAIKFTPAGGQVTLSLRREQNQARIEVADTGQGISADFLPYVFDMYGQGGNLTARTTGGLGIGLALVKQIVHLHGGRVEANSEGQGRGARFTVWLPLQDQQRTRLRERPARNNNVVRGLNVLLVDDMVETLDVFKQMLEADGAHVFTAHDGIAGLEVMRKERIDLVISDISMPNMDGYAFINAVREMPDRQDVIAIALSGLGRGQDVARAIGAGFDAHLNKPLSMDVLTQLVQELFAGRSAGMPR